MSPTLTSAQPFPGLVFAGCCCTGLLLMVDHGAMPLACCIALHCIIQLRVTRARVVPNVYLVLARSSPLLLLAVLFFPCSCTCISVISPERALGHFGWSAGGEHAGRRGGRARGVLRLAVRARRGFLPLRLLAALFLICTRTCISPKRALGVGGGAERARRAAVRWGALHAPPQPRLAAHTRRTR